MENSTVLFDCVGRVLPALSALIEDLLFREGCLKKAGRTGELDDTGTCTDVKCKLQACCASYDAMLGEKQEACTFMNKTKPIVSLDSLCEHRHGSDGAEDSEASEKYYSCRMDVALRKTCKTEPTLANCENQVSIKALCTARHPDDKQRRKNIGCNPQGYNIVHNKNTFGFFKNKNELLFMFWLFVVG